MTKHITLKKVLFCYLNPFMNSLAVSLFVACILRAKKQDRVNGKPKVSRGFWAASYSLTVRNPALQLHYFTPPVY